LRNEQDQHKQWKRDSAPGGVVFLTVSEPLTRRIGNEGMLPGADRRTTSKRRVCPRRGERHATQLSRRRPEAANPIEG
jgi:hypothetical protein